MDNHVICDPGDRSVMSSMSTINVLIETCMALFRDINSNSCLDKERISELLRWHKNIVRMFMISFVQAILLKL